MEGWVGLSITVMSKKSIQECFKPTGQAHVQSWPTATTRKRSTQELNRGPSSNKTPILKHECVVCGPGQ